MATHHRKLIHGVGGGGGGGRKVLSRNDTVPHRVDRMCLTHRPQASVSGVRRFTSAPPPLR